MTDLTPRVIDFLERDEWHPVADESVVTTGFEGSNGRWACYAVVLEDQQRVLFYSLHPEHVAPEARPAMAELLTRVNFELVLGNFEIDLDDGETRFRTSLDVEGSELTDELLRQVIYANVSTMDHFAPAIYAVASGQSSPVDALAAIDD
jgi:hypothetical protein